MNSTCPAVYVPLPSVQQTKFLSARITFKGESLTFMARASNVTHNFSKFLPFEGALALKNVLEKMDLRPKEVSYTIKTMFGDSEVPFQHIPVEFSNGDKFLIPWGQYALREGDIRCGVGGDEDDMPCFAINGIDFMEGKIWQQIIEAVEKEVINIYKGRALRMKFDNRGNVKQPQELLISKKAELIFNPDVEESLETSLFFPIENAQACRDAGVPLKRGILLEAPYGMGKSLTASVTAHKAIENGFTFIIVPDSAMIAPAFTFAKRLAPAVVFVEDIDEFLSKRRENINEFLNTLDGVDNKDAEIITVYSTNYVDTIDRALLRPGRVDALIALDAPNEETINKIILAYGNVHAPMAAKALVGASPALIRECVERAKLLSMKRKAVLNDNVILEVVPLLKRQRDLMAPVPQPPHGIGLELAKLMQDAAWRGGYMGFPATKEAGMGLE